MFTPRPRLSGFFVLSAALLAFAACTDRNPAGLPAAEPEPVLPPSSSVAVLKCTADVRAGTLACLPQGAETPAGVSATILGGQGTYVRLASSGTSYDGTSVFRTDVTVENLTSQALGTADGTTPSPDGVRVFLEPRPADRDAAVRAPLRRRRGGGVAGGLPPRRGRGGQRPRALPRGHPGRRVPHGARGDAAVTLRR